MSIQWPLAKNQDGEYVHIKDATKGARYQCPECSARFVARQGEKVRWHFAHYPGVVCTGEGSRHSIAKHLIASRLSRPIWIPLRCSEHNLPTKRYTVTVTDVKLEAIIQNYRVDVACQRNGRLICIEVVDQVPVSSDKTEALQDSLVVANITDLSDEEIFAGIKVRLRLFSELSRFFLRLSPKPNAFIHIWQTPCQQCNRTMLVAMLCSRPMFYRTMHPSLLTEIRRSVKLKWRKLPNTLEMCMVNLCPHCGWAKKPKSVYRQFKKLDKDNVETRFWVDRPRTVDRIADL